MAQLNDLLVNGDASIGGAAQISNNLTCKDNIVAYGQITGTNYLSNTGNQSWVSGTDNGCYKVGQSPENSGMTPWISQRCVDGSGLSIGTLNSIADSGTLYFTYQTPDSLVNSNYNNDSNYRIQMIWKGSTGQLQCTSFNATSDARLKENFKSFIPQKSILDLPIYKFDFISGAKNQIGCKAQDLREICPEIVNEDSEGYLSIQESKIVYLLIDEIKKLKEEIKMLKENM